MLIQARVARAFRAGRSFNEILASPAEHAQDHTRTRALRKTSRGERGNVPMSVRENLLRLHRWRLQERQDYLAGLESLMGRLRADAVRLREEIGESEAANGHGAKGGDPPPYLVPLIERRTKIERSMAEIEVQIGEARGVVEAAQQEVKHAENGTGANAPAGPMRVRRRVRRERHPRPRTEAPLIGNTRLF
jgi:hypothetical protein